MSLDVHLAGTGASESGSGIFVREKGQVREITRAEWDERFPGIEPVVAVAGDPQAGDDLYSANITHNLARMADAAGIYQALWRPEEIGITLADQLVKPLEDGLTLLRSDPDRFKAFNPDNGWGDYDGLVGFVEKYLEACRQHPAATVSAYR